MTRPKLLAFVGISFLTLMISGCREEEQGRPLAYTPGVYMGAEDETLTSEEVRALQQRATSGQSF